MSDPSYLIIHKDHPMDVHGVNSGAEMATLCLAQYLVREGKRVIVCAQLVGGEEEHNGVKFWDLGDDFNVGEALRRADEIGLYHLISAGRSQAILESRDNPRCLSRTLISHDRSGNDTGISPKVLGKVVDNIICVSHAQSRVFLDYEVEPEKVHVIHNGVDLELFDVGETESRDYRRLVFVGALVQDKGIHFLLQSFVDLKSRYPDLKLDVYGSAALWGREKFIDEEDLQERVPDLKFHGSVSQQVISEAYKNAGICVVPSIWFDPFPLTALEAQVTGCPVVTFDVGGLPEGVRHNETGIVLQEISQDALTRCLDQMLSAPGRLKEFSKTAIETARPYFTWDRVVKNIIEVCEEAAAKRVLEAVEAAPKQELTEKKLGFLTTWNQECGLATYAKYLISQLPSDTYVILAEDSSGDRKGEDEAFVERCWKRESGSFDALHKAVKENDIGLLHLNCHYRFFPQPAFSSFLNTIRAEGVKVVLHLHTVFTVDGNLSSLVQAVDKVLVHSPENKLEVVANGGDPERIDVIAHGVDLKPPIDAQERLGLRKELDMPQTEKVICSFGFVQPHKGIEAVIEAVAHLNDKGIAAYGYIAGKPNEHDPQSKQYLSQLQEASKLLGVEDRIVFLNRFLDDDEVTKYLRASDLVMMSYHSNYYEASGACSLAVGAGAVVAASTAPALAAFGNAVWHLTGGYPAGLSAELLLTNTTLRETIVGHARRYCEENSWPQISIKLQKCYAGLGFKASSGKQADLEIVEDPQDKEPKESSSQSLRVLMQNRPNTFSQRGGDTVVMEKLSEGLKERGVEVVIDVEGRENPADFDLVHLYNFALPDLIRIFGERAHHAGTPFVVTTLCEDVPIFHNQSSALAASLVNYVRSGQSKEWYQVNKIDVAHIPPCPRFENGWIVENAAALFTNGASETEVLKRYYSNPSNIIDIALGHEIGTEGKAEDFIKEYGVSDFVFCVGRLESRKNQLMLLKALEDSELPVVFAGGGFTYQPDYAEAVRNFKRKGKTIILDRVSAEMLAGAYRAAKVHVLPSWYELPGLVSLEAAYHGCNVVVTRNGTSPDYFKDQAFYCDPADEMSIYDAVMAAYNSPFCEGLKEVAMSYTWDKVNDETLEAYQQVTGIKQEEEVVKEIEIRTAVDSAQPESVNMGGFDMADGTVEFQEILEKGELAARNREYNLALEYLDRALGMNPRSIRALRASGAVYLAENNIAKAADFFNRALGIDSGDSRALSGLGMCEMKQGSAIKAYECYLKALDSDPYHLVTIFQLVECCYVMRKYDDLVRVLEGYLEAHPEDSEMRFCLAGALYKQKEYDRATELLNTILTVNPTHLGSSELLEQIKKERVNPPAEDQEEKDQAAVVTPDQVQKIEQEISPELHAFSDIDNTLSVLEEKKHLRDFEAVHQGCEEILNNQEITDAQREQARLLQAEVAVLHGDLESAEAVFKDVLIINPQSARALCGRGAIDASRSDWESAEKLFDQARMIDSKYDVPLAGLGMAASCKQDYDQAWVYYKQALRCNPESVRAILGLLELGYHLKRLPEVEEAIKNYLEMHPGDLDFVYSLAGCYFAQNRLEEAKNEVDKITLFDPSHEKAIELRGMIESRLNDSEGDALS